MNLTHEVIARSAREWHALAERHRKARLASNADLTRQHHDREEQYWRGKAQGIEYALKLIQDSDSAFSEKRHDYQRREQVSILAAQTAKRERTAFRLKLGRFPNEDELGAIWDGSVAQAVAQTASEYTCGRTL